MEHLRLLRDKGLVAGRLGTDYIDVLLLGWHPRHPAMSVVEWALSLKKRGLVKFFGLSSHRRTLFPELFREGLFDLYHVRYNAVHRGAESKFFPYVPETNRPGVVSFTATSRGKLLNPGKMSPGEKLVTAVDCSRFALPNPVVDICMVGAKTMEQMHEDLKVLEMPPMNERELARMQKTGDYISLK